MDSIQARAGTAYGLLEDATRGDGTPYVRTVEGAPGWVTELVREAHGDMLPDDWRYATIREALGAIHDAPALVADELADEFADDADVYNADLLAWVGSHGLRGAYVDEAREEIGEPRDFYHGLQMGQYLERREVFQAVYDFLAGMS